MPRFVGLIDNLHQQTAMAIAYFNDNKICLVNHNILSYGVLFLHNNPPRKQIKQTPIRLLVTSTCLFNIPVFNIVSLSKNLGSTLVIILKTRELMRVPRILGTVRSMPKNIIL